MELQRTYIKDVFDKTGEVLIKGWIYRHRSSGNVVFAVIRDVSGIIQATIKKENVDKQSWKDANEVFIESSVEVFGEVVEDKRAPGGKEIRVKGFKAISKGEPYPITKDQSDEFLMDVRHLWLRSRRMSNIMKIRHYVMQYLQEFLNNERFFRIEGPIITTSGAEGGSDMFEFDYFGKKAYLTQSNQLYAEAMIFGLERVYTLEPTFRAEKSRTTRHLAEFWMLEPEAAFVSHEENLKIQENMVSYVVKKILDEHNDILDELKFDYSHLEHVKAPFYRMDYEEAVQKVNEKGGKMKLGEDFGADEEALVVNDLDKPVFVTNYPKDIKAFYMKEDPKKPGTVLNDDMLAPGVGEIIGGSERIADYETLLNRMKQENMDIEYYKWYLDLRRYGSVQHSGFGLGVERFIKYILKLPSVREAIPFPRTITRVYP